MYEIGIIIIFAVLIIAALWYSTTKQRPSIFEDPQKRAGREGEYVATNVIKSALRADDYLLTNVSISYDGQRTELDKVIVNKYGVFIIEVKNYKGKLHGKEEDYEWEKWKKDGYGNVFVKEVKNPIQQVERQIRILNRYLDHFGICVDGYAFFVQENCPLQSEHVIENVEDIDRTIHTFKKNRLNKQTVEYIQEELSCNAQHTFCM